MHLGNRGFTSSDFFAGEVDDVRVWNKRLTQNEIRSFISATNLGAHPQAAHLVFWTKNDAAGSTTATDESGNGGTGTGNSGAQWVADGVYQKDADLRQKFADWGYDIDLVAAGDISEDGSEATCASVAYISSTVTPNILRQKLRDVNIPVIVARSGLLDDMGMVQPGSGFKGLYSGTEVNIITTSHEISNTLPGTGNTAVLNASGELYFGKPEASAIVIGQDPSDAAQSSLFAYEAQETMVGMDAPARRVGFFLNSEDASQMTANADSLLRWSLCWARGDCPTTNTITTNTLPFSTYCPNDTVRVPFTATGLFDVDPGVSSDSIFLDLSGSTQSLSAYANHNGMVETNQNTFSYGGKHRTNIGATSVQERAVYTPNIRYAGVYTISMYIPDDANTLGSAVPVTLQREDSTEMFFSIDMESNKGSWYELGDYHLALGQKSIVQIDASINGVAVVADAMKFVSVWIDSVGNDFVLQLSDKLGNFTNPQILGRLEDASTGDSIKGILPSFLSDGSSYRVRVVSTSPSVIGTTSPTSMTIRPSAPELPNPIIGNEVACQNATIQGYKVNDPVIGETGFEWKVPLGANILSGQNTDSVTVEFITATTNEVKVKRVSACGVSGNQRLEVILSAGPPEKTGVISGKTVVCNAMANEAYSVSPVVGATSYKWILPAGAVIRTGIGTNAITADFKFAAQGANKIFVASVNDCGESDTTQLNIVIDNLAALSAPGSIVGNVALCPGSTNELYYIPPVAGAFAYNWTVNGIGASIDSVLPNQRNLNVGLTNATIGVSITNQCGTSDTSTLNVNVAPSAAKKALVITNAALASAGETTLKTLLENEGYAVEYASPTAVVTAETYCYSLIVLSPGLGDNNVDNGNSHDGTKNPKTFEIRQKYKDIPVPTIVMDGYAYVMMGIADRYEASNDNSYLANINLVDAGHDIAAGYAAGNVAAVKTYYTNDNGRYGNAEAISGTYELIAQDASDSKPHIWTYDKGATMSNGEAAPARRVGFTHYGELTQSGNDAETNFIWNMSDTLKDMFAKSICWATNTCSAPTILATDVSPTSYCAGEDITVTYTVSGAINASNDFRLELSDASGAFGGNFIGTVASNSPGTKSFTVALPIGLPTGAGYKVRVVATDPATNSNETSAFTVTAAPAKPGLITGLSNVCNGHAGLTYSVADGGLIYTWSVPAGSSIQSGQGTNAISLNMSGATSGAISVYGTQNGCVGDTTMLPITFAGANDWTGNTDTDWFKTSNWYCGYLPTFTQDVTISAVGSSNYPVINATGATVRNLTINHASASLGLTGGDLSVKGDFTINAGSINHSGGTLKLDGTSNQKLDVATSATFHALEIANNAGVTVQPSSNLTVNNNLTLTSGHLTLGENDLTIAPSASISGGSQSNYIRLPDNLATSKRVRVNVPNTNTDYVVPVGNTDQYNPVTIRNILNPTHFDIGIFTGVFDMGNSGTAATEKAVSKTWKINAGDPTTIASIKVEWFSNQHLATFLKNFAVLRSHVGGVNDWKELPSLVEGSGGVFSVKASGITGASNYPYFSVYSTNNGLPPIVGNKVYMLVADQDLMTSADTALYDTLESRYGFTPELVTDNDPMPDGISTGKMMIVSPSATNIRSDFKSVPIPMVIFGNTWDDFGISIDNAYNHTDNNLDGLVDENTPLNRNLSGAVTALSSSTTLYKARDIDNMILGYAADESGNSRDMFMVSTNMSNYAPFFDKTSANPRNSAIKFDGTAKYVRVKSYKGTNDIDGTKQKSASAWINVPATLSDNNMVVIWGRSDKPFELYVDQATGHLKVRLENATVEHNVDLRGAGWKHVAIVSPTSAKKEDIKLYVDGNPGVLTVGGSNTGTITVEDQQVVRIGTNVSENGDYNEGGIDDVAIWSVTLSDAQVLALFNASNDPGEVLEASDLPLQDDLEGYWDFATPVASTNQAVVVAMQTEGEPSFVGIEKGASLNGYIAGARRVTMPFNGTALADGLINANGWQMMDNAMCFIQNTCPTDYAIATGSISSTEFCQGQNVNIPFTTDNTFPAGNEFVAVLSDASGNFNTSDTMHIGSMTATTQTFAPITATLPDDAPVGSDYRVRVQSSTIISDSVDYVTFNGTDVFLEATSYDGVNGTTSRTVELWFKTDLVNTQQRLVAWGDNAAGERFTLRIDETAGTPRLEVNSGAKISDVEVDDNKWHHLAVVIVDDGSPDVEEALIYVDGVLTGTSGSPVPQPINTSNAFNVRVGRGIALDDYVNGGIRDVRIWAAAVSDANIAAYKNSSDLSSHPDIASLEAWWKLDEGMGTSIADASGNGNTATLNGSPQWDRADFNFDSVIVLSDNGSDIEIKEALNTPSIITGDNVICPGETGGTYSVVNDPSATFYNWEIPTGAIGTSTTNSITVDFNTATGGLFRVSANNGTCASGYSTLAMTFDTANIWTGASGTSWADGGNWSCAYVPNMNTKVVIPNGTANKPVIAGSASCRDIFIGDSTHVTMTSGALRVMDKFVNNGKFLGDGGAVVFDGAGMPQTVVTGGDTSYYCTVRISNPANVRIVGNIDIRCNLDFQEGKLQIGTFMVKTGMGATITGAGPGKYIQTEHVKLPSTDFNGWLVRHLPADSSTVDFPIGLLDVFSPCKIQNTGGAGFMKARTFTGVYKKGRTGDAYTNGTIDRSWEIYPLDASLDSGHFKADVSLEWKEDLHQPNFFSNSARMIKNHSDADTWDTLTTASVSTPLGGGRYRLTSFDVDTFSVFTVTSDEELLPVTLVAFNGYNVKGDAKLLWQTSSERLTDRFVIEKSVDGLNFNSIDEVAAKGGMLRLTDYDYTDESLNGITSYYRLRIVDIDSTVEYSRTVKVSAGDNAAASAGEFILYPNPVLNAVNIEYTNGGSLESVEYELISTSGQSIDEGQGDLLLINEMINAKLSSLANGVYILKLVNGNQVQFIRFVKHTMD